MYNVLVIMNKYNINYIVAIEVEVPGPIGGGGGNGPVT